MDKKYKLKPDLTYPMCRQSHLMMQTIADCSKGKWKGFYTTTYGPIAKAIDGRWKIRRLRVPLPQRQFQPHVRRHGGEEQEQGAPIPQGLAPYMQQNHLMFPETEGGPDLLHHYNDDNDLLGFGPGDAKTGLGPGIWTVYHSNTSRQGAFNDAGDRPGKWTYWDSMGNLDSEGNSRMGKWKA